jgi:3-oxoacyl-(acyl-carrier-protein) synthase
LAGWQASDLGHVNAQGLSTVADDRAEAEGLAGGLAGVPVTAPSSYFGHLGAAAGPVEMAASLVALETGLVAPTLNFGQPDPKCNLAVVHGEPQKASHPTAISMNWTRSGQVAAVLLAEA